MQPLTAAAATLGSLESIGMQVSGTATGNGLVMFRSRKIVLEPRTRLLAPEVTANVFVPEPPSMMTGTLAVMTRCCAGTGMSKLAGVPPVAVYDAVPVLTSASALSGMVSDVDAAALMETF